MIEDVPNSSFSINLAIDPSIAVIMVKKDKRRNMPSKKLLVCKITIVII
jgi:hypothetical protein